MTTTARTLYYSREFWVNKLTDLVSYIEELKDRSRKMTFDRLCELIRSAEEQVDTCKEMLDRLASYDPNRLPIGFNRWEKRELRKQKPKLVINGINFDVMLDDAKRDIETRIDYARKQTNLEATIHELIYEIHCKHMDNLSDYKYAGKDIGLRSLLYDGKPRPYYKPGGRDFNHAVVDEFTGPEIRYNRNDGQSWIVSSGMQVIMPRGTKIQISDQA